jgi:hypothetical protein
MFLYCTDGRGGPMFHRTITKLAWDFSWPRRASVCLAIMVVLIANPAAAEKRVALVIGNGAYTKVPQLPNPPHRLGAHAILTPALTV